MNTGGWIVMLISVISAYTLLGWCIYRVVKTPPNGSETPHTILDPTPDAPEKTPAAKRRLTRKG